MWFNKCVISKSFLFSCQRREFPALIWFVRINDQDYGTFVRQRAFQLSKCVDYHQSLNNKPILSYPVEVWEITGKLQLASYILYISIGVPDIIFPACRAVHHLPSGSSRRGIIKRMFNIINFLSDNLLKSAELAVRYNCSCKFMSSSRGVEKHMRVHAVWCVPVSWSWLRIPGVLQRLGFTYFVLSLLQTFWGQKDIPLTAVSSPVRFTLVCPTLF